MNRDTELLKIQVYADYCHSTFTSYVSFIFGGIIAFYVTIMGLFLQKTIDLTTYTLVAIVVVVPFLIFMWVAYGGYHSCLNRVDELIEKVNKGEPLPSIKDIRKL